MSSLTHQPFQRQRFHDASDSPAQVAQASSVLQLLLGPRRIIARGPVALHVVEQRIVDAVPAEVLCALPGTHFIVRITCLAAHGEVMMDNLSYIALEGLPTDVRRDLEGGVMPIGHLLSRLWVRRSFPDATPMLYERLWSAVGLADASPRLMALAC